MKKLVMLFAAAMLAVCTHASAVSWSLTKATDWNGYTAYATTASAATILAAFQSTDSAAWTTAMNGAVAATKVVTRGSAAGGIAGLADGDTITFVILSDGTKEGSAYFVSTDQSVSGYLYDPPNTPNKMNLTTGMFTSSGTLKSSGGGGDNGPEPTSGLLMLVGGAMLALRRKQK